MIQWVNWAILLVFGGGGVEGQIPTVSWWHS